MSRFIGIQFPSPSLMDWRVWAGALLQELNRLVGLLRVEETLVGDVTLTVASATSTLTNSRFLSSSVIVLTPKTLSAAAELAVLRATYADGTITLTHNNSAVADRTYRYKVTY